MVWSRKKESLYKVTQKWLKKSYFNVPHAKWKQVSNRWKLLKYKIYKKMTANDSKSYLSCLNKLIDEYNNTYHHSINKKPNNVYYSALTEDIESHPKFKSKW